MPIDSNNAPPETTTSPEKAKIAINANAAADKMIGESQNAKPPSKDHSDEKADLKKAGVPDLQIVDANVKPAQAPEANENSTPPKSPSATNTESSKPPEPSAGSTPSSPKGGDDSAAKDVWDGVWNEVDNHPWRLVGDALEGAAVGAGVVALAATSPVWGPVVLIGGAVAGATYGGYEIHKGLPGWENDAKIADNPSDYTAQQVQQSNSDLNNLGGDIADQTAGTIGAVDGGAFTTGLVGAFTKSAVADVTNTVDQDAARDLEKNLTDKSEPPNSRPAEQDNPPRPSNSNQPPADQTTDVPPQATPPAPGVIADSLNPADYIRRVDGPGGEQAAQAYQMARNILGEDVQGITGSYASGAARTGQWPVADYDTAAALDKMPEDLPSSVQEQVPPEFKAMYDLRQQLPTIPSDLDIVVSKYSSNLEETAKQIFDTTGVLVEFCPQ